MHVRVVPIRRLPGTLPWLTYRVPDRMHVTPGCLVEISLRQQRCLGIVWDGPVKLGKYTVEPIITVIGQGSIITPWLRSVMTIMSETGACSLGDVAYGLFPKVSLASVRKNMTTSVVLHDTSPPNPTLYIWYRRRLEVRQALRDWLQPGSTTCQLIVSPTIQDVQTITSWLESMGLNVETMTSMTPATKVVELWQRLHRGERVFVVGTLRAITLPFPTTPRIFFDQAEHHAHKVAAQHPRYSARLIVAQTKAVEVVTSSAPPLDDWQRYPLPEVDTKRRQVASLNRDQAFRWLSDEAIQAVDTALIRRHDVFCIVPQRGYASSISCRQCGYLLACPTCQRRAAVVRGTHQQARCTSCATTFAIPDVCPTCQSTAWQMHGLGIDRAVELLRTQWPESIVVPETGRDVGANIRVGTYSAYQLNTGTPVGLVLVLCGDALLNVADYSVAERAWQYLARLVAFTDPTICLIQTFQPEGSFWQRWRQADDQAWYTYEQQERQRLHLPPFATQWIARTTGSEESVQQATDTLQREHISAVEVVRLPETSRQKSKRLLLTFATTSTASHFPWPTVFPTPWQVDKSPTSWRD